MSLDENVARSINTFKELVSELDKHTDDSAYFYKLSDYATWIAKDINTIHSGYYVAFVEYGPDDNFVRLWYPLGFMTAEKAYKILNEELVCDGSEPWNDGGISGIEQVSKEKHDRYYDLIDLQRLYDSLCGSQYMLCDILPKDFINELRKKVNALREELGLKYRWESVCSRY